MEDKQITLLELFWEMMLISTFTFGGGFVIISMMRQTFCDQKKLISDHEVLDMTAIAQSAPGALAVNSAIIFGYRLKGIKGALIAVLATIIPPIIIISVICFFYDAFSTSQVVQTVLQVTRAGVAAVIVNVVIDLAHNIIKTKDVINIVLMVVAFVASWYFKVSAITLILLFIALGIARSLGVPKEDQA